jgi:hypothetical protein
MRLPIGYIDKMRYELMEISDDSGIQIWKSPKGKFSLYESTSTGAPGKSLKFGISDIEKARQWVSIYEGKEAIEPEMIGRGAKATRPPRREVGYVHPSGFMYLGGGDNYQVWFSPSGDYQIAYEIGPNKFEEPYKTGLTREEVEREIRKLGVRVVYQPELATERARSWVTRRYAGEFKPLPVAPREELEGWEHEPIVKEYMVKELPGGRIEGLPEEYFTEELEEASSREAEPEESTGGVFKILGIPHGSSGALAKPPTLSSRR